MPGRDGLEILEELKRRSPSTEVIMISGHGTVQTAIEAAKKGAFDFVEKPLDRDKILITIRNAFERAGLAVENRRLVEEMGKKTVILGESVAIREILATIDRVAPTHARVLVMGENGTGKELVARRLHLLSTRRKGPFVDVNCAAIPRELIESELFGHEKGAFTGADRARTGKFEQASGGTLFLDEVGDMDLGAQAKVLRVLEESRVTRVGGNQAIDVDVRVIAATNKDLPAEAKADRFREDLYYRLNVVPIVVPPLRERRSDVPILVSHFLADACRGNAIPAKRISEKAMQALARREWPGNVRELRNFVERIAILHSGATIEEKDVLDSRAVAESSATGEAASADLFAGCASFSEFQDRAEKEFLARKLRENEWNVSRTAESLKMQRSNLYKKIDKYGLK
jgi:two-component system nitrogen regulation response regulator NtrX